MIEGCCQRKSRCLRTFLAMTSPLREAKIAAVASESREEILQNAKTTISMLDMVQNASMVTMVVTHMVDNSVVLVSERSKEESWR